MFKVEYFFGNVTEQIFENSCKTNFDFAQTIANIHICVCSKIESFRVKNYSANIDKQM